MPALHRPSAADAPYAHVGLFPLWFPDFYAGYETAAGTAAAAEARCGFRSRLRNDRQNRRALPRQIMFRGAVQSDCVVYFLEEPVVVSHPPREELGAPLKHVTFHQPLLRRSDARIPAEYLQDFLDAGRREMKIDHAQKV